MSFFFGLPVTVGHCDHCRFGAHTRREFRSGPRSTGRELRGCTRTRPLPPAASSVPVRSRVSALTESSPLAVSAPEMTVVVPLSDIEVPAVTAAM